MSRCKHLIVMRVKRSKKRTRTVMCVYCYKVMKHYKKGKYVVDRRDICPHKWWFENRLPDVDTEVFKNV